jgi:tetratricopeptide (TPR) repeat protein
MRNETQEVVMNARLAVSSFFVFLFVHTVAAQPKLQGGEETGQIPPVAANAGETYKQSLMSRIGVAEAAVRQAESTHAANRDLGKRYILLGLLYQDAAEWEKSETVLMHAVSLARKNSEPAADLAIAISQLGSLHVLMGKLRDSEKEDKEALKIRQSVGDPLDIARSRSDLAILYLAKQNYRKARSFAQEAEIEIATNERAIAMDRIVARITLSEALCYLRECPSAIPLLKAALEEAKVTMRPADLTFGVCEFLLGYGYWKSGDMSRAEEYLRQGTELMSARLGWGHPAYLRALRQYAQFLHEDRQVEAAKSVERRIRQSEAVVDVHSIQTAQGMFSLDGLR